MIPPDLHQSGNFPHSAGRRQGGEDERYSAAVDRDGTGLGSHPSVNGSVLRVLRVQRIPFDFHE